jgi:glutamine synthetase
LTNEAFALLQSLEQHAAHAKEIGDTLETALFYKDVVLPCMERLRRYVDEAETITAKEYWPYPSYGDMLFSIK